MNAAIRAVVRKAIYHGLEVIGINRGYSGFIEADMGPMNLGSVADIVQRGGTMLHSARSQEFLSAEGRARAWINVERFRIQGLVIIGGDGSFRGAKIFHEEYGIPVVGVPGTIDNDIPGTDFSIGFDTAVNTALDAINKIRDTATSHERTFVVEVMGRESGAIALSAGLAGGAESILIPEIPVNIEEIIKKIRRGYRRGKLHSIIVVAEGAVGGMEVAREIQARTGFDTKVTILGHLQRGGTPSALDRIMASRMGAKAVELLMANERKKMIGQVSGYLKATDLDEVVSKRPEIDLELFHLADILSI